MGAQKAEGLGAGAKTIPAIFSARKVKVKAMLTKINGLVNEYTGVINAVRARWPMGLGKKLNDFESLAVRMGHYEATLAKLTAALAGKKHKPAGKKPYSVPAPEWPGN